MINRNRTFGYVVILVVGGLLFVPSIILEKIDSFWGGLGAALGILAIVRLLQVARINKNKNYAKKWSTNNNDERIIHISTEARSRTFYFTVIIEGILIVLFTALNMMELVKVLICLITGQLMIYCFMFYALRSKY
ncbi:hypothetical protein U5N28_12740 [Lysinibacillus telephonicus]|uniref:Uncharacterized protein n=1 Tax=Lysinibacillus telephonicus TaxID=1714840 RepID=A0A3S0HMP2_9BACI|nr:hypothetical protein [Lysinibacillus telephonicus]RTQ93246.1 hypothetical protein EKG35_09345 [Lysinibacillus telephonicus]